MTFFPDMGTLTMAAAGPHVRAIGWLEHDHPFPQGEPPHRFLERLQQFTDHWGDSARVLDLWVYRGGHNCDFCSEAEGFGCFGVPSGDLLFVAPDLVTHYVRRHRYLPPAEFVAAVLASPIPGTAEYRELARRFRNVPISPEDERRIDASVTLWKYAWGARRGKEIPQDHLETVARWREAADQGLAEAQHELGIAYAFGAGVPLDYVEAHKWLDLAASRASEVEVQAFVETCQEIEKKMTHAQVLEAQKRAREWAEAFERRQEPRQELRRESEIKRWINSLFHQITSTRSDNQ